MNNCTFIFNNPNFEKMLSYLPTVWMFFCCTITFLSSLKNYIKLRFITVGFTSFFLVFYIGLSCKSKIQVNFDLDLNISVQPVAESVVTRLW